MSEAADKQACDKAAGAKQDENRSAVLEFGSATEKFQITPTGSDEDLEMPITWDGLAIGADGHLLLPAKQLGLHEYSLSGQLLSSWRPSRQTDGKLDFVDCVTVLNDGCVAAGIRCSRMVVILRRETAVGAWQVDREIGALQSNPLHLASCGDLLAIAEGDGDDVVPQASAHLVLANTSSGQLHSRQQREYDIGSVVLTEGAIITKNDTLLMLPDGRQVHVLEAYNHSGDQKLWRYVPDNIEYMWDVTLSVKGGVLYVATELENDTRARVAVVSVSDGNRLLDNALRFEVPGHKVARALAIGDGAAAGQDGLLVLLDWDGRVSLHPSFAK